jgi:hypothetical protein
MGMIAVLPKKRYAVFDICDQSTNQSINQSTNPRE